MPELRNFRRQMDSKSSNCEISQFDFVLQNHTWKTCFDVWSSYIHSLFVIRVIFFASREYWTYKIGEGDTVLELILITNFLIKSQCAGRAHKSGSLCIQSPRIMKVTDSIKKVEVIENKTNQIWGLEWQLIENGECWCGKSCLVTICFDSLCFCL